ncbi:MAG TPA: MMPL family transporter [Kineosporiaceae bacterium]|nr:MMPL family transporter [Kineosporiaceae bacterium]
MLSIRLWRAVPPAAPRIPPESTVAAETPAPTRSGAVPPSGPPAGSGSRRRLRWLLPAALLVIWFGIAGAGGSYQLSQVQKNDSSSYLPASAESSRVAALQRTFSTARNYPATLLVTSDRELTPQQLSAVRAFVASVPDLEIPVTKAPSVRVGDFLVSREMPPVTVSSTGPGQGKAALAVLNFDLEDLGSRLADGKSAVQEAVGAIRKADATLAGAGLKVYVAGPAAQVADLVKAFGGVDGILILVAVLTVLVILLVVYRSPVVPLLVLLSAGSAYVLATLAVYQLAKHDVITLDGQAQGILSILVIGAATDYALLLVARYREELRRHDDRYEAMALAWRRTLEPVAASAGTVVLGLLCLLLSGLGPTRSLGPVGAIGIASALLASLTFLPAVLVIPGRNSPGQHGRWIFWPQVPHLGSEKPETAGIWGRVSRLVGTHPRRVWTITAAVLIGLACFVPTLKAQGASQADTFLTAVESVTGGKELPRYFPGGSGSPAVVIGPADRAAELLAAVRADHGVQSAFAVPAGGPAAPAGTGGTGSAGTGSAATGPAGTGSAATGPGATGSGAMGAPQGSPKVVDGRVQLLATLSDPADSDRAIDTVRRLRSSLDAVSPQALVGGGAATNADLRDVATSDRNRIIPVILLVIFVVLALLLRALVAPLVLLVANVLSFAATLGASAVVFNHVFHFPGADAGVPLYGFVFLVALGIDYSIFLMVRVREESGLHGTRPGILSGLAVTGGVITSAGVVLAATFAALGVIPILFLAQTAFIVAFGVLLDTLVVRSLLVPALSHDLGRRIWLPGRLARATQPDAQDV